MLPKESEFSQFGRIDWTSKHEVSIRFLVEILAHAFRKEPDQIISIICSHSDDLPRLRYDESDIDDSDDPQWMLSRYHTALHTKDLLSNVLQSSTWGHVPENSIYCREEIKYKGSTFPNATVDEIVFEANSDAGEIKGITRIITPQNRLPFDKFWASRDEFENYLSCVPAFSNWLEVLPEQTSTMENPAICEEEAPQWLLQKSSGNKCRCGPENSPVFIEAIGGFEDLRYAIVHDGDDCFHLDYLAEDADQANMAAALQYSQSIDVMTPETIQFLKDEIEQQESDLASANDASDIESAEKIEGKLSKLREFLKTETMPGGKSRKMTEGDPNVKAAKAMRDRKNTLLKLLENSGLEVMAEHIRTSFNIRNRTFAYNCGPPFPKWTLY